MHSFTKLGLGVALAASSAASPIRRSMGFNVVCDGASNPDWSACGSLIETINGYASSNNGGDSYNYIWQHPGGSASALTWTQGDCTIALGFLNNDGVRNGYLQLGYHDIAQDCNAFQAGGSGTLSFDSAGGDDGTRMSVEIYRSGNSKRTVAKRDTTWEEGYTISNYSPDSQKQQLQDALPKGASWTLTQSDAVTNSVTASASFDEDLFEIVKASQSISYNWGETVTSTITNTIPNTCDGEGFLYWYPLYTLYHGGFVPDGPSPIDIYVPQKKGDGSAAGAYKVNCST